MDRVGDECRAPGRGAVRPREQGAHSAATLTGRGLDRHRPEPGRSFEWTNVTPGLTSVGRHRVDASGAAGSRVTLSIAWSGVLAPLIRALYGGLSRRYVDTEAEGLKRRCE